MLNVTPRAREGLLDLLREKGADPATTVLRLSVSKGGCAGMQYEMGLAGASAADTLIDCDGARVAIDPSGINYLEGCTLDHTDDLTGAGFRIVNPRASRSCGCGTSFEPAE